MPSAIEVVIAVVACILFFLIASVIGLFLVSLKSPCEGCNYYLKDSNKCLFNPIYGYPVPKQCQREEWDI